MQALILAAGSGVKIAGGNRIPKSLVKVGNKTLLEHNISQLPDNVKEIVLVVGPDKNQIKKKIGINYGSRRIKYLEQPEMLGTGHALYMCKDHLTDGKFVVLMGDNLYHKKDIEKCLKHDLSVLVKNMESPDRFGVVKLDKRGILLDISESPKIAEGTDINCGLYVLDKRIFDYPLAPIGDNEYGLPQQIAKMAFEQPIIIEKATFWLPISTIQDIKYADKYLKNIYK